MFDSDNYELSNQKAEKIKQEKIVLDGTGLIETPIKGKVINLDTMPSPKVVRAGNPRVVPFNDFTFDVSSPKIVKVPNNIAVIVPGKNAVPGPEIYKSKGKKFRFIYPEAVRASSPSLLYGPQGYTKCFGQMQGLIGLALL